MNDQDKSDLMRDVLDASMAAGVTSANDKLVTELRNERERFKLLSQRCAAAEQRVTKLEAIIIDRDGGESIALLDELTAERERVAKLEKCAELLRGAIGYAEHYVACVKPGLGEMAGDYCSRVTAALQGLT